MARAAAFAFASLAPASISASYSSSISIRFLRAGPLDAPFYNRTGTAASTHKSLNNRDLQGGPARNLTFGDKFDREIAVNETKPRAAPDGRLARIFGRQFRFRRVKNIVPKLSQLIDALRGYVFIGEELHPPGTYGVTVVSRSIKAAE